MSDESSTILARLLEEISHLSKRVEELEQRNQELEARNQELEAENKHLKDLSTGQKMEGLLELIHH